MSERSRLRLVVLRVLVVAILVTLFSRLWYLQVYSGDTYREAANANRVREVVTPAGRGEILDAQGRLLVANRTALVVSVNRSLLSLERDKGRRVLARLAPVVGIAADDLAKTIQPCSTTNRPPTCWNGSPYQPVPVKVYSAEDPAQTRAVLAVEEHREDFRGVSAQFQAIREYPGGTLAAHLLGYLGPIGAERERPGYQNAVSDALVGKSGVEATYDAALRGRDGVQRLLVDKDGNVTGTSGQTLPVPGDRLVLSLDQRVQRVADAALERGILKARSRTNVRAPGRLKFRAPAGAVVVLEAKTGRVVAMSSYPSYDPKVFQGRVTEREFERRFGEAAGSPLTSRATQGLFAPGSTFKVVSTAAAVESGRATLNGAYFCGSQFRAGTATFRNFDSEAFGTIDLRTALVRSCDTIYYRFGYDMWVGDGGLKPAGTPRESMVNMAKSWGFGSETGIDLPSEADGRIASRDFKKRLYVELKKVKCERAKHGYPEVAATNPKRAELLKEIAREFCLDGDRYRAGDAINFSIGQGDTVVTPLQLATAYAALANGGTLFAPRLAKGLLSADGRTVTPIPPAVRGKLPVRSATLAYIRNALAGVTDPNERGTARAAFAGFPRDRLVVAGKTGTAEVQDKQDTSWFASYAPANNPEFVVVTMVEQAGTGGATAAPITREVYEGIYGIGRPAALPGGRLAKALPRVRPDGFVAAPGDAVPGPAPRVVPFTPAPTPRPSGEARAAAGVRSGSPLLLGNAVVADRRRDPA